MGRLHRRGLIRAVVPLVGAVGLWGAGCAPAPAHPGFTDQVRWAMPAERTGGQLPWFCTTPVARGPGGDGHGHGGGAAHYTGRAKGTLSWADCLEVAGFLDKALETARRFPTRRDAQAAGAVQAVQFLQGVGTHDVIPGVTDFQFDAPDPARPFYLQYDGDGPDARLAGMSWYVVRFEPGPPPGPAGDNDHWHSHETLCYSGIGTVVGNEIDDAECARRGGVTVEWPYGWMLHAWIVPGYESRFDVFAESFGCVRGTGPYAPPDDPCYRDFTHPEERFSNPPPPAEAMALVGTPGFEPVPLTARDRRR
jgi:hypothetical protein